MDVDKLVQYTEGFARQEAIESTVSLLACCVAQTGALYLYRTASGRNVADVINQSEYPPAVGEWSTLERTSQGWVVVGVGAYSCGPIPVERT